MSIFNTGKALLKNTKVIPIFLTINDAYAPYAACTIASIIEHSNPKKHYRIIILHDGLRFKNYFRLRNLVTRNCEIQFHKMTHNIYLRAIIHYCAKRNGQADFYSSAVYYYRSFIARLFPRYDKAIYIDSDTILLGDIAELFEIDLGENVVGATVDAKVQAVPAFSKYVKNALNIPAKDYVNSGVLLLNTKKLRHIHYISRMIKMINQFDADLVAPDQDYLNVICKDQIFHLPENWNQGTTSSELPKDTKLVHYNLSKKPWFYADVDQEEVFWEAAKKSGYYNELLKQQENYPLENMQLDQAKIDALIKKAEKLSKVKHPLIKNIDL